jgi:FAD synthase
MGNFCHGDETKNSQMETMGMDACMMIGYHNKVSKTEANQSYHSKLENYVHLNVNVILINYPVYAIHDTKKGHLMWIRCLCAKLRERGRHTFVFLFQPFGESSRNRATYLQSRGI